MVPSHLYFCLLDWSQAFDDTFICQYHKNAIHLMGCNKTVLCLERFKYHQVYYKAIKISTNNDSIDICCDNIENIDHWADYFVIINTWSTCMEDLDNVDQLEISKYFQPNQLHLLTVNFKFLESTLTLNMPGIGIELGLCYGVYSSYIAPH